jgi:hypothetical protein
MIDTLRFARRLKDAGLPEAQAEAIAEGFAEETRDALVTREYLDTRLTATREYLDGRLETLFWRIVGTVAAMLLANVGATWAIVAGHH